tara:strand:+ start:242 stop:433 length:192 start_codon:yes stop_codon:yes gene_type:complete
MSTKKNKYWDDLTPEEKDFLKAYRNSPPERQEIVKRILELFHHGKDQEAFVLLADTFANDLKN